jgi:protein MpaA
VVGKSVVGKSVAGQSVAGQSVAGQSVAGQSIDGLPIRVWVLGEGPETLMVLATIHGNESAGTPLVRRFAQWLEQHPAELDGKRVVLVPVANPDGLRDKTRHNRRDVDLNRNFPAGNWSAEGRRSDGGSVLHGPTPLSEPESRAIMRVLCTYFPDRVVSIHQPVACVDYDGPAAALAAEMSAACELPVSKLGSRPGSLGSFVGLTLQRPIITLELPAQAQLFPTELGPPSTGASSEPEGYRPEHVARLWERYGGALIAALRYKSPQPGQR